MARPSSFQPEYSELAYKLCLLGATDVQIADFLDTSEQTLNKWKKDFPEFLESLKRGKAEADAVIAQSLFHRAKGYSHPAVKILVNDKVVIHEEFTEHYPPDTTACIFWLKNRRPDLWRDAQKVNHEHTGAVRHEHVGLSATDALIAEAAAGDAAGAPQKPRPH